MSATKYAGIQVLSDLPQPHLDRFVAFFPKELDALFDRCLAQGAPVARFDVFRRSGTDVLLEVHPVREKLATFVPTWSTYHVCPDCGAPFERPGDHPDNGCTLGVVENVLRQ